MGNSPRYGSPQSGRRPRAGRIPPVPAGGPGFILNDVDRSSRADRRNFYGFALVAAITCETIFMLFLMLILRSHIVVLVFIWICLVIFSFLYKSASVHEARNQEPSELQRRIPVLKSRVPIKSVERLLTDFKPDPRTPDVLDEEILLMTRRHKFMLIRQLIGIGLLMVVLLVGFFWLQLHPLNLSPPSNPDGTTDASLGLALNLPWWVPLLIVGCGFAGIGVSWLSWSSYYLIVTKTGFVLQRIYSPFFFWLPTFKKELPRRKIDVTEYKQPFLARLLRLDYGANMSDTAAQGDKAFNALDGFPNPAEIRRLLFAA